ncbi:MAG: hypothetical protein J5680_04030 [Neisseriaceae bacterium]|nr:hypothetical protein [Neisseriaceae bacterium]
MSIEQWGLCPALRQDEYFRYGRSHSVVRIKKSVLPQGKTKPLLTTHCSLKNTH